MATKKTTAASPKVEIKKAAKKVIVEEKQFIDYKAENIGFKAGDVYQALAKSEKAMSVAEIAKQANISSEEVYLGLGWLFKEGKVASVEGGIALA